MKKSGRRSFMASGSELHEMCAVQPRYLRGKTAPHSQMNCSIHTSSHVV
jgi:hypothetical protein